MIALIGKKWELVEGDMPTLPALYPLAEPPYIAVLYGKHMVAFTSLKGQRYVIVEVKEGWKVPIPLPEWGTHVTMDSDGTVYVINYEPVSYYKGLFWTIPDGLKGVPDIRSSFLVRVQDPERYDWRTCLVEVSL